MSFSFYVPVTRAPDLAAIAAAVGGAWDCPDAPADDPMPEGAVCHPILVGAGARGIELAYEGGRVQVRIFTCSSRADHELAFAIIAQVIERVVEAEDRDAPLTPTELATDYGDAWITDQVAAGTGVPLMMAARGESVTLGCARRAFVLGPRLHAALAARAGGTIGDRLLDAMIALQAFDGEDPYAANLMEVRSPAGETFTVAVWAPGVRYLFPKPERFAILCTDGTSFMIPGAEAAEIRGTSWRWVDEEHAVVEPLEGDAWTAFEDAARRHAID